MTQRAAPLYCPYCGDEDLAPSEDTVGENAEAARRGRPGAGVPHHTAQGWLCGACRRVFTVHLLGLNLPEGTR